jgi:multiple sugar transport system substrate-binding protein
MKKVLIIMLALTVTLFLSCSGGSKNAKTFTVWYWGEQEIPGYQAYMTEVAANYAKANNIKVEVVLQESDNLVSAFRTAESAGEAPDLAFLWGGSFALEDAWLGNIVPISDYLTPQQLSVMDPFALNETKWDGKQWCFPAYSIGFGVAYNKKMMSTVGVDPENPYVTWDEFINVCQKLKDAGYTPLGGGLKDGYLQGWLAFYLGQQNYDDTQDAIKPFKLQESYTDPKCSEWVFKVQELIDKGFYNDDIQSLDFYQGQQLLENGKAAMSFYTSGHVATIAKAQGDDTIGFTRQPIYGSGRLAQSIIIASQVFVFPKSAKNKEEGAKFLMFLQSVDNIKKLYDTTSAKVPNVNFQDEWLSTVTDKKLAAYSKTYPSFVYQYVYPANFEYECLVPIIQRMFNGEMRAEEAVKEMDAAIKKWAEQSPDQVDAYNKW